MNFFRRARYLVVWPLVTAMLALSMPIGVAHAALVGTEQVIDRAAGDASRAQLTAFLARADVRTQLRQMGVDADEAALRVASLSDTEVRDMVARIDQMPAGQGVVSTAIGIAILILLILLITDLAGVTDVYPFDKKRR